MNKYVTSNKKNNSNLLEKLKYKNLISNFASQEARKIDFK